MIFIEQKRAKIRLIEHPATHASQFNLKRNLDSLTFNLQATAISIHTKI
jgi:hypothetical protein